jgi:uncharacterized protein (TIGR01777 family)
LPSRPFQFVARSRIAAPAPEVFAWHERPGAFERFAPPWQPLEVVARSGTIHDGAEVALRLPFGPAKLTWRLRHVGFQPGREFRDEQVSGPFKSWTHVHRFDAGPDGGCIAEDRIRYELPMGVLGRAFGRVGMDERLAQLFAYRHAVLAADVAAHRRFVGRAPARVAIAGASGLIGRALAAFLSTAGIEIVRLVRPQTPDDPLAIGRAATWDPAKGTIDASALDGVDAVVNLAGENVGGGRWTAERRERLRSSRLQPTRTLAEAIARAARPPSVIVSASAIGRYRANTAEPLDERGPVGDGFLAELSGDWESATEPASARGVRVVNPRIGIVLTPAGGALAKLLPAFRAGVGGRVGEGTQTMSWIALDDVLGALHQALCDDRLAGPVNLVAPAAVTNEEFAGTLGAVLGRPSLLPVPAVAIETLFGEMGRALLLEGQNVVPRRLLDVGYPFRFPTLPTALAHLLGRRDLPPLAEADDGAVTLEL